MMWPSVSATWIWPAKVPYMMTSSCASVRFVASLLTTIQNSPLIRPPKLCRLSWLSPSATMRQRGSTFTWTGTGSVANTALA